jgi:hypothetical protein
MFGLDDAIASYSDGAGLGLVVLVAILLGLRHATDPDHVAAVSTLVAAGREARPAALLGAAWGVGHALTLLAFGLPIVLYGAILPDRVQQGAEAFVGVVIVALAVWLLVRWRRGAVGRRSARTPLGAFAVGLAHGVGGSAGVGILIVAAVESQLYAVVALGLLSAFTAVSMVALSTGLGLGLAAAPLGRSLHSAVPALGVGSLAFGTWYVLAAFSLAPYYF